MRMYYIYIVYDVSYFLILGLIEILNLCTLISGNAFISHFVLAGNSDSRQFTVARRTILK